MVRGHIVARYIPIPGKLRTHLRSRFPVTFQFKLNMIKLTTDCYYYSDLLIINIYFMWLYGNDIFRSNQIFSIYIYIFSLYNFFYIHHISIRLFWLYFIICTYLMNLLYFWIVMFIHDHSWYNFYSKTFLLFRTFYYEYCIYGKTRI